MKFKKEFMKRVAFDDLSADEGRVVEDKIIDITRWSEIHRVVFEVGSKFYSSSYSRGLTEMQYERPYDYESCPIECPEVWPIEATVIRFTEEEPV